MKVNNIDIELISYENIVQPFFLNHAPVRGRVVRMGAVIDDVLQRHAYPLPVSRLLGEMLTLTALLSTNLPENGILTLQAKGSGAVSFLVTDANNCVVENCGAENKTTNLRGYANLAEDGLQQIKKLKETTKKPSLKQLMGEGYLAITLDTGLGDPYQGIVPLEGDSLSQAVQNYFVNSQQMDVLIQLAVRRNTNNDGKKTWKSGGIMLERMPEDGGIQRVIPTNITPEDAALSSWEYNSLLFKTTTNDELLDPHLSPSALLYRLFNEGGVWINDQLPVNFGCRCSRDKIDSILSGMAAQDLEDMKVDGKITVTCQFCNNTEEFS